MTPLPSDPALSDHRRFRAELERRLASAGDTPLAELADGALARAEALADADRTLRRWEALGLSPGDRVAVICSDDRRLVGLVLAALRGGYPLVVGDPKTTAEEAATLVAVCRPAAVLVDGDLLDRGPLAGLEAPGALVLRTDDLSRAGGAPAGPRPDPSPGLALLIFTSGTTSIAKAVALTYANLHAQLGIFETAYGWGPGIRLLNLLPVHHTDGLTRGPVAAAWFGGTLCRPMPFGVTRVPALLDAAARLRATHLIAVPAMLRILERLGRDQAGALRQEGFRFILCSADVLDAALWRRVEATFGVPVVNAYGLSEAVCDALFAGPGAATRVPGTIGRPVGLEARIVDPAGSPVADGATGELVLAGPTVMQGYFGAPEATAAVLQDGALRTGDLVRRRPDGLLEFVGRSKTAIVSNGVTIHPEGVTAVLQALPGVAEAHAFGVPDPDRGERLVAAVVPAEGAGLDAPAIWSLLRERLPPERLPVEIRLLDRLPRTESGKVVTTRLAAPPPVPAVETPATGGEAGETVYAVAARLLRLPQSALSPDSTPFNTPGWDSLAHMALITAIETAFAIEFAAEDVMDFTSLGDVEAIVRRLRA